VLALLILLALPSRRKPDLDSEDAVGSGGIGIASTNGAFVMAGPGGGERALAPAPMPGPVSEAEMASASDAGPEPDIEPVSTAPEPVAADPQPVATVPEPVAVEPEHAIEMEPDSEPDLTAGPMPSTESEE
jgi:hypothetical protein